jgi:hypothetical protein
MAWKTDLVLMLRSLIGDLDRTDYTDERLKQILVAGAYNVVNDADFSEDYSVDISAVTISPDPVEKNDTDFACLTVFKSACILMGSEAKTQSTNAISIKDGPSSIDLREVSKNYFTLYQDFCKKYEEVLKTYQYNNTLVGQVILGPYSPGGMILGSSQFDFRGNNFN